MSEREESISVLLRLHGFMNITHLQMYILKISVKETSTLTVPGRK